jgi:valyl-tRNA synthetase
MGAELAKAYDPSKVESRIYRYWLDNSVFDAEVRPEKEPFCIVIPPPNVTGALHMGHALDETVQDLLIRWERMRGKEALWLPGTDHAGIATQNVVEEQLAKEGLTRHDLGRERFVERVWKVKQDHHSRIIEQLQRFGSSCDWRRERFTLDEGCSRAVREAFVTMYERGWIYKGARMINWCPRCTTGLSDLEVEHEERNGHLWYIQYPVPDSDEALVVATTRPETMLGDTAVAVSPDDRRYARLVGKTAVLPLMDRPIPVITDAAVDPEFAAGALKVTPGHDPTDLEIGQRHNLPSVVVIGEDGKMTEEAGKYAGLDRDECRKRVVEDLEQLGLLTKIEPYVHAVGSCSRCDTIVEPLVSEQWFVRPEALAEAGLEAVSSGKVKFVPARWTKVYTEWLEGLQDWCISRQLWWGHQIPAWTCEGCGEVIVNREDPTECPKCGAGEEKLTQEEDVLDTWFSSGLWPFSTLGWPDETPELDYFHPTSVLVTAYDIIFFWVARMIMMAMTLKGEHPFDQVFIHGLVRDSRGRKMSKSLGNVVDPLELMDEYGADSLRFALTSLVTHGQDITVSPDKLVGARNFCNKLWNAARFVLMNLSEGEGAEPAEPELADRWILSRHNAAVAAVNDELERRNLGHAAAIAYEHVWGEFCDWYVELAKTRLYGDGASQKARAQRTLSQVFEGILKLLHPIMPFITEELWQTHGAGQLGALALQPYPTAQQELSDAEAEAQMQVVIDAVTAIRSLKADLGLQTGQKVEVTVAAHDSDREVLSANVDALKLLARCGSVHLVAADAERPEKAASAVAGGVEVSLHMEGLPLDVPAELARLAKQIGDLAKDRARSEKKLANKGFAEKAPAPVVQKERERLDETEQALGKLQARHDLLKSLSE